LKTLIVEHSRIKFENPSSLANSEFDIEEKFESKQIHFNLSNLEQLDLNQMTFCRIWLRPYDNFFQLFFENLPKLKTLRFSIQSLAQVDLDLFKKLGTLENLAIWFYESTPFFMDIKNVLSNLKQIKELKLKCSSI